MNRKHININDKNMELLNNYMNSSSKTLSKSVNELLSIAFDNSEITRLIKEQNNLLISIIKKENVNLELLKQFYSDMGIVGLSNPKKCDNLNKILSKIRNIDND